VSELAGPPSATPPSSGPRSLSARRSPKWRRRATDPRTPVLVLAPAGVLAAVYAPVLTWAILGGLAGYTLSGSV
jgi:hypothetical protein